MRSGYLTSLLLCCSLIAVTACSSSDDPTFASLCPKGDQFYYPVGSETVSRACYDPTPIAWDRVPLVIQLAPDVADSYTGSAEEAINFWNSNVGINLFRLDNAALTPDVNVVIGSASDDGDGATYHDTTQGTLHATVEIRQPGDITSVYYIMAHEFGHVLDLAHDGDVYLSVMYPKLDFTWDGVDQSGEPVDFRTILVTGADRDALRGLYASRESQRTSA